MTREPSNPMQNNFSWYSFLSIGVNKIMNYQSTRHSYVITSSHSFTFVSQMYRIGMAVYNLPLHEQINNSFFL